MRAISKERVGEIVKTALQVVADNSGQLATREVLAQTEKKLAFTDYEKAAYEKSGYIRWQSILHFYSIDCVKAGWLRKNGGVWFLTEEGRKALLLPPLEFYEKAGQGFRHWKQNRPQGSLEEA